MPRDYAEAEKIRLFRRICGCHIPGAHGGRPLRHPFKVRRSSAFPLAGGRWGWGLRLEMKRSTPFLAFPLPGGRDRSGTSPHLRFCPETDTRKGSPVRQGKSSGCQSISKPLPRSMTHSFSRRPKNSKRSQYSFQPPPRPFGHGVLIDPESGSIESLRHAVIGRHEACV
jgi:hypothetical protein